MQHKNFTEHYPSFVSIQTQYTCIFGVARRTMLLTEAKLTYDSLDIYSQRISTHCSSLLLPMLHWDDIHSEALVSLLHKTIPVKELAMSHQWSGSSSYLSSSIEMGIRQSDTECCILWLIIKVA